jgi:murein L,D-transpeptidase YcbB/YkuD
MLGVSLVGTATRHAVGQDPLGMTVQEVIGTGRIPWARWPDFSGHVDHVRELYAARPTPLVWFDGPLVSSAGHAAIAALLTASDHGLDRTDYDAETLQQLASSSLRTLLGGNGRAHFDLLLSVNLIRFLDDLQLGRLHPRTLDRAGTDSAIDLAVAIRNAIAGDSIPLLVAAIAPQLAQYRNLQRLLKRYRRLAADSSLAVVPQVFGLQEGDRYPGVALRQRLAALGDLESHRATSLSDGYTRADAVGVRRFQSRHGLAATGVLDSATVLEINTPFERRVRQIELALERLRWLPPIGHQRFVVVNIPAFQLFAFDSAGGTGAPALSMRVIVGNALDTRTPVLFEQLRYVEFRPYWNVPLSITVKEIVPLLRRDPGYLSSNDMELVGPRDSVVAGAVTSEMIDRLGRGELRVRQRPGSQNPLGLTKFVFPNSAAVYLHGTPRTDLFAHTRRDFSHGCIRVEDPTALAQWVLRDQRGWSRQRIIAAQEGPGTTRAWLTHPIPVVIFYTTAVAAPDGSAWFHTDLYGHDRELDEALRAGPVSP